MPSPLASLLGAARAWREAKEHDGSIAKVWETPSLYRKFLALHGAASDPALAEAVAEIEEALDQLSGLLDANCSGDQNYEPIAAIRRAIVEEK